MAHCVYLLINFFINAGQIRVCQNRWRAKVDLSTRDFTKHEATNVQSILSCTQKRFIFFIDNGCRINRR